MAATWRKRWLPSLPLSVTVFCFWLLMNDEISVGQVVMALVLALVIPPFAARLDREFARIGRLRSVPRMLGVLLWDIVQANVTVALQVLGPERKITAGFHLGATGHRQHPRHRRADQHHHADAGHGVVGPVGRPAPPAGARAQPGRCR
jgi:hypothetical protein